MFFYQRKWLKIETRIVKIRNEWGVLHELEIVKGIPQLTDHELAEQLEVDPTIVIRRLQCENE